LATAAPAEQPPALGNLPVKSREVDAADRNRVRQALVSLPLRFIPALAPERSAGASVVNAGQTDPAVQFTAKGAGHTLFFTEDEVVFAASRPELTAEDAKSAGKSNNNSANSAHSLARPGQAAVKSVVRLHFPGANPQPAIEGLEPLPGAANFFLGNDPARWQVNLPTYGAVVYRSLYPGIDLVYRGTQGRLKSEFYLAPGADPDTIQLAYQGVKDVRLGQDGALMLQTPLGELIEEAPLAYQEVNGVRHIIPGGYVLLPPSPPASLPGGEGSGVRGEGRTYRVAFRVGAYNPALPLVIDPELAFSTYLGGGNDDFGFRITVDGAGNAYVTG
jgi:hypothetical protein